MPTGCLQLQRVVHISRFGSTDVQIHSVCLLCYLLAGWLSSLTGLNCRFGCLALCSTAVPLWRKALGCKVLLPCSFVGLSVHTAGVDLVQFEGLVLKSRWPTTTSDHQDSSSTQLFAAKHRVSEPLEALCMMGGLECLGSVWHEVRGAITEKLEENYFLTRVSCWLNTPASVLKVNIVMCTETAFTLV